MSASYVYNSDGIRTQKTVNGVTTNYYLDGNSILRQVTGNDVLEFFYDTNGVLGFYYNNTPYYYLKNLQGDIVGILDANGTQVVSYTYDAWGAPLSVTGTAADTIGQINPFRYRSYYYDNETGLYYLNSRYYDPETYRFLNADGYVAGTKDAIQGSNVFAYCMNNPVNMSDSNGSWPKWVANTLNSIANTVKTVIDTVVNTVKSIVSSGTESNVLRTDSNSLPKTGEPDSSQTLPNPDGTPKQKRWYGPDGNAVRDRDYNHPGDVPFPHDHEWKNGKRGTDHLPPSPEYEFSWESVVGVGLVTVCIIAIVAVAADDATGIGVADDFLFVPLGTGLSSGMIMIFG